MTFASRRGTTCATRATTLAAPAGIAADHCRQERPINELRPLIAYLLACRSSYLWGALWLAGTNVGALAIPWLLKLAVESLQHPAAAAHGPAFYGMAIIVAALLQGGIRICSRTVLLHAGRRIEFAIREEMFRRLVDLDASWFDRERTGDIISRFANDLTNVRMLTGFGCLNVINSCLVYTATITLMLRLNPSLTLLALLPFPAMILAVKRISASMYRRSRRAQEELARLTSAVEENVTAAAVVRAYCREEGEKAAFGRVAADYLASNMAMARLRGLMVPIMAGTGAMGTLVILFIGGRQVIAGAMSLGDFVAFNGYLAMLVWPTLMMGWILNLLQRGAASMTRINAILSARPRVAEPEEPAPLERLRGEIELRDLSFSHGDDRGEPVLRGISLRVPAGTRLGIVGPVGSGKSTLVSLIPRLYPVADGCLFLDGIDINRIPLQLLRRDIGFIPQESLIFSRSIGDNIAFGREGATTEDVRRAAERASLAGDIGRFPDGYGTRVGERGVTLSGGQKQRTSIARALVKPAPILILDDPLSAVDARTGEEILARLEEEYGNTTLVIVSHRLAAVRNCQRIILLDGGRIAEQGSHDELLAMNGRYAALWREQQLRDELEAL
jgi:ATP-binding cassette subfamily B protein